MDKQVPRHAAHQVFRSVAAEQHVDMAGGGDRGAIGRDHVLAAVRMLKVPGEDRQPFRDLFDVENVFVMDGPVMVRDLSGTDQLRVVAAQACAKRVQGSVRGHMAYAAYHHSRVDARACGYTDPFVYCQLALDHLHEWVAKVLHTGRIEALLPRT